MRLGRRSAEGALLLAGMAAAVVWLSGGCEERVPPGEVAPATRPTPPAARIVAVVERRGPGIEWASGAVASARQTAVAARTLARIEDVTVTAGSVVAAGDVLVRLDARDLAARAGEAEQALRQASARLELARTENARAERLFREGAGTAQRLDQTRAGLRAASAEVERLGQALEEARTGLSFTVILAPVGGRVVDRLAEPGDTTVPGRPLLRIYDPSRLRVEAPVRESLAVGLQVGAELPVEVPALDLRLAGEIEEIVPFAEPGARTLLVKVAIRGSDPRLFAGMFARVGIPAGETLRRVVPAMAVERVGQLEYVTVVAPDGAPERRLVTSGERDAEGFVEILSGLRAGERVALPEAGS